MAGYLAGDVDEWIYIDIEDQHPDSIRFIKDCEKAIGKKIEILNSREYELPLTVQPDRKPRLNSVVSDKLFRRGNS